MRKRIIMILLVLTIIVFVPKVEAKETIYYTTPNGIELTEKEYTFLTTFYWKNYVDIMTEKQYEEFKNSDLLDRRLITKTYTEKICKDRSTIYSTSYKTLKISAACSSNCSVSLVNEWTQNPTVRSYDDIGMYLSGLDLVSYTYTAIFDSNGSSSSGHFKTEYATSHDAIGSSVLLPSGSNIIVNQVITTTTGGHIFGSYQHATQSITLPVAKSYTFSLGGYGNVFLFNGNAVGVYDGMAGVDIYV